MARESLAAPDWVTLAVACSAQFMVAGFLLFGGRATDLFGRRRVFPAAAMVLPGQPRSRPGPGAQAPAAAVDTASDRGTCAGSASRS